MRSPFFVSFQPLKPCSLVSIKKRPVKVLQHPGRFLFRNTQNPLIMKQKEIIDRLRQGDRLINNALVSPTGDTHPDTITQRQIVAIAKKVRLAVTVKGPFITRRMKGEA